jgi:hypothetical protein
VISRIGATSDVLRCWASRAIADLHTWYYAQKTKIVQRVAI